MGDGYCIICHMFGGGITANSPKAEHSFIGSSCQIHDSYLEDQRKNNNWDIKTFNYVKIADIIDIVNLGISAKAKEPVVTDPYIRKSLDADKGKIPLHLSKEEIKEIKSACDLAYVMIGALADGSKKAGIVSTNGSYMRSVNQTLESLGNLSLRLERILRSHG